MRSLEELVRERYPAPEWVTITELSGRVGSRGYDRRADVAAFNCWPSKGNLRVAFEVKRTRADFSKEIDQPEKREWLEKFFHQTYFVVEKDIVLPDEVPSGWGLLVRRITKNGDLLYKKKIPRHRDVPDLPEFIALSAMRSLQTRADKRYFFDGDEVTQDDIDERVSEILTNKRNGLIDAINKACEDSRLCTTRKRELERPLRELSRAAGEYYLKDPVDVQRLVGCIRAQALEKVCIRSVREAHSCLGKILERKTGE